MPPVVIDQIIRSRRRTLGLQINSDASLIVRAPQRASLGDIQRVVQEKLSWINKKQQQARQRQAQRAQRHFNEGEEFLYLGQRYKLLVSSEAETPLSFTEDGFQLSSKHHPQARSRFIAWYKQQAFAIISQRVRLYADQAGLTHSRVKISSAKKQWGSCNTQGVLNFSWRVIMAPIMVVDYVVAHELAHLVHHNHSKRFWNKVGTIFPPYREAKAWLRQNHHLLEL